MKLRKLMFLVAMTAAIGSVNMFTALADEEEAIVDETIQSGWVQQGSSWRYFDMNGQLVSGWIKAEDGDGRGNEVWYYIDPATNVMVANETRVVDGVAYAFGEDGSWVAPRTTAPKGKVYNGSFFNTWSNIRIPQVIGSVESDYDSSERYTSGDYTEIGSPMVTDDLYMMTDFGDVEIYYADMKQKPDMDAAAFANALVNIEKGSKGQVEAAAAVTIGNQGYAKASVVGKKTKTTYYCRKQDGYMVIICTMGSLSDMNALEGIVNTITTAQ